MSQSRWRMPHTLTLLFLMICLAWVATKIMPHGQYVQEGKNVIPGTYRELTDEAQSIEYEAIVDAEEGTTETRSFTYAARKDLPVTFIFEAIPMGFYKAWDIAFFIFIVGGAFAVLRATGSVDALIGTLLRAFRNVPGMLVGGMMFLFCAGSSTIGMAEEYIPFVPVLLILCRALRFDAVTAVGIMCCGYAVGYGCAIINPFTVVIAQGIAGVPPSSGVGFRLAITLPFLAVAFLHVWRYANKVRKDPSKSLVADIEAVDVDADLETAKLSATHAAILSILVGAIVLIVFGIKYWDWYLTEMTMLFLGLTILMGIIGRIGERKTAEEFCKGAAELTSTALLLAFAYGIERVLSEGQVIHTLVNSMSQPLNDLGPKFAAVGMLFFQSFFNFAMPSGSGQAGATMPIMAPLADVVGVQKQTAVLAYQFGDGFTNILVPTNPVLVGILAIARIPYDRWFRFILPFMLQVWLLASIVLVIAVSIDWN